MQNQFTSSHRANVIGSLWMIASMAAFAIEDTFVKFASAVMPVAQILVLFGLGGALVFAVLTLMNGEPLYSRDVVSRPMQVRFFFEIVGRLFYVLAISLIPLSSATVILQATPLVVVLGAAIVFGEKVGWRRWIAIGLGMIGVLIIVQPGMEAFSELSLLAIIGMVGFAGRDLASRAAPASLSVSVLGLYGFLSVVLAGALYAYWQGDPFVWPTAGPALALLCAVLSGVAAYTFLMKAMRIGQVSSVTPFRYSRMLFGLVLGISIFGEQPSYSMVLGSSLIVVSGLFIMLCKN